MKMGASVANKNGIAPAMLLQKQTQCFPKLARMCVVKSLRRFSTIRLQIQLVFSVYPGCVPESCTLFFFWFAAADAVVYVTFSYGANERNVMEEKAHLYIKLSWDFRLLCEILCSVDVSMNLFQFYHE